MNKKSINAFLITRSMPLSDGLDALLGAIPQIDEVEIARNIEEAVQQIEAKRPHLVLIDSVLLGTKPEALLRKIASLSPTTQRILLVDDVQDMKWMPEFAEAVLIKGISPAAIAAILTNLLFSKGDEHEHNDSNS